jgi:hypothetical protein
MPSTGLVPMIGIHLRCDVKLLPAGSVFNNGVLIVIDVFAATAVIMALPAKANKSEVEDIKSPTVNPTVFVVRICVAPAVAVTVLVDKLTTCVLLTLA